MDHDEPVPPPILVSDAERERSIGLLRDAVAEGRLTLEELSERVGRAHAARTDAELTALGRDLRQARLAETETEPRVHDVFGTVTVLVPEGIEVTVTGGGLFAGQTVESPQRPAVPGGPRLAIHSSGPGGTLHVRARPTWQAQLKQAIKGS